MTEKELKIKTKEIAVSVAGLCMKLPPNKINNIYTNQVIRSSASIGANYCAACRAKSTKDFIYKLQIVEEEADESLYFLELLAEFNEKFKQEMRIIYKKTDEILRIMVASIKTSQRKQNNFVIKNQKSKPKNQK